MSDSDVSNSYNESSSEHENLMFSISSSDDEMPNFIDPRIRACLRNKATNLTESPWQQFKSQSQSRMQSQDIDIILPTLEIGGAGVSNKRYRNIEYNYTNNILKKYEELLSCNNNNTLKHAAYLKAVQVHTDYIIKSMEKTSSLNWTKTYSYELLNGHSSKK